MTSSKRAAYKQELADLHARGPQLRQQYVDADIRGDRAKVRALEIEMRRDAERVALLPALIAEAGRLEDLQAARDQRQRWDTTVQDTGEHFSKGVALARRFEAWVDEAAPLVRECVEEFRHYRAITRLVPLDALSAFVPGDLVSVLIERRLIGAGLVRGEDATQDDQRLQLADSLQRMADRFLAAAATHAPVVPEDEPT